MSVLEVYQEKCRTCAGTGSMESSDSTDDSWWDCRVCGGNGKGEWRWHVRAGNGEIVLVSLGYADEADARQGFEDSLAAMLSAKGAIP